MMGLQQHNISTKYGQPRPRVCSVEAALPREGGGGWRPPGPFLWRLMGNIRAGRPAVDCCTAAVVSQFVKYAADC